MLGWAYDVACALQTAHAFALPHGAVRPSAVVIAADATARVDDWVLGRALANVGQDNSTILAATARFTAPEFSGPGTPGIAADVFCWASTFYEALVGSPAFDGASPTDQLLAIAMGKIPDLAPLRAIDEELGELFAKCWRRRADERPTAEQLAIALESMVRDTPAAYMPQTPAPIDEPLRDSDVFTPPPSEIDPLDFPTLRQLAIPNHVPDDLDLDGDHLPTGRYFAPLETPTIRGGPFEASATPPAVSPEAFPRTQRLDLDAMELPSLRIFRPRIDREPAGPRDIHTPRAVTKTPGRSEGGELSPAVVWGSTLVAALFILLLTGCLAVWSAG